MRAQRAECESNIYHVISRGVGRHTIFEEDADRERYLCLVGRHMGEEGVAVYAWCLMDNHVHLLLCAPMAAISSAMRKVNSSYALYYNRKYDHPGHLFQGRFKSEPVGTDAYFLTVMRYIHMNPEKAGMASAGRYRWSSYREYVGEPVLCDTSLALGMLGSEDEFAELHRMGDSPMPCMASEVTARSIDDEMAREIALHAIGEDALKAMGSLGRAERDALLVRLKDAGLSSRKIERLTGIGRGIVNRAGA